MSTGRDTGFTGPTDSALLRDYDAVLADLDGTLLLAGSVIEHVVPVIRAIHSAAVPLLVVTNNASRTPESVAQRLTERGIAVEAAEVVNSPQAAGEILAGAHAAGEPVLVLGTDALAAAVAHVGLRPVRSADDDPVAVVQGYSPEIGWRDLAEGCIAIRAGAQWVATNTDATLPTDRGELPGNGALVQALVTATGKTPVVAGKPERPLIDAAIRRAGAHRPLVVGDRLETDIAAAVAAGCESLMVLTGASTAADVLATHAALRPTFVAADLRGLLDRDCCVRVEKYDDDDQLGAALEALLTGAAADSDTVTT